MSRLHWAQQLAAVAVALGSWLGPAQAWAQNPAAAEALFEQARAAMAAGSYDIACARFRDSDKLDPAVGTRFNLADCEEKRGRLATAWSLFRGVSSELAPDDDRKPIADERAAQLKPRLPIVTLVLPPDAAPGLRVRIDGVEIGEGTFGVPLPMDPGKHELSLQPAGEAARRSIFELREGQQVKVSLSLDALPEPASEGAGDRAAEQASHDGDARRRWAYVAGGVGIAGALVGTVAGILTLQKKSLADDECSDETRTCSQLGVDANRSGKRLGVVSGVGFGIGVVGLAAGAYLLLTSPSASASAHTYPSSPSPKVGSGPHRSRDAGSGPHRSRDRDRDRAAISKLRAEVALEPERGFVSVAGRF